MTRTIILLPALLVACSFGTATEGEKHNVDFAYDACFFGCSVAESMMVGTQESVRATASAIPAVTVKSTSGEVTVLVVTRSCCTTDGCQTTDADVCNANESAELDIGVRANFAGTADIQLVEANGTIFDAVTLSVAHPASFAITCDSKATPITIAKSDTCAIGWQASDSSGNPLLATSGVTLSTSDATVVELEQFLGAPAPSVTAPQGFFFGISLVPMGIGDAVVTLSADHTSSTFGVTVTP